MIRSLLDKGLINIVRYNNDEIFVLSTPCRFRISRGIVEQLKLKYLSDEEIGGVLLAHAQIVNGETIILIDELRIIRNAIEDSPRFSKDGRLLLKSNAYLRDSSEYAKIKDEVFTMNKLPIKFHTHPTKGKDILDNLRRQDEQMATSVKDLEESKQWELVDDKKILLPRVLIVGNKEFGNELFVGVYDGFIAPGSFEETKSNVRRQNMDNLGNVVTGKIEKWNVSDKEKLLYGIGAVLLLGYLFYRTRRFSLPVITGLVTALPILLSNTTTVNNPCYYNRLTAGDVDIFIPKDDGEYHPAN